MSRTRNCVDPDTVSCKRACPQSDRSYLDVERGSCICSYDAPDDICDNECSERKPKITIQRNSTSSALYIVMKSADGVKVEELGDDYGIADYDNDEHHTEIVRIQSSGVTGVLITNISQAPLEPVQNIPSGRARRSVTNTTNKGTTPKPAINTSPASIPNPFICIEIGSAILFRVEVNEENRSLSNYPRYNKDHLFNKNDRFDYGNFRLLHSLIRDTNKSLSTFANVFTEAGVFVFYDNGEPLREMIVKVTAEGEKCSEKFSNQLLPASSITLTQYRVAKSEVSVLHCFLFCHFKLFPNY